MSPVREQLPEATISGTVWTLGFLLRGAKRGAIAEAAEIKAAHRWESAKRVVEAAAKLPTGMRENVMSAVATPRIDYGIMTYEPDRRVRAVYTRLVKEVLSGTKRKNTSNAALWTIVYKGHSALATHWGIFAGCRMLHEIANAGEELANSLDWLWSNHKRMSQHNPENPFTLVATRLRAIK